MTKHQRIVRIRTAAELERRFWIMGLVMRWLRFQLALNPRLRDGNPGMVAALTTCAKDADDPQLPRRSG